VQRCLSPPRLRRALSRLRQRLPRIHLRSRRVLASAIPLPVRPDPAPGTAPGFRQTPLLSRQHLAPRCRLTDPPSTNRQAPALTPTTAISIRKRVSARHRIKLGGQIAEMSGSAARWSRRPPTTPEATGQRKNAVMVLVQAADQRPADRTGRAGNQNSHRDAFRYSYPAKSERS